jgi:hypothetical protein
MISTDALACYFDPASAIKAREDDPRPSRSEQAPGPGASFVRGVAVGLAVAVPVWACIILSSIR